MPVRAAVFSYFDLDDLPDLLRAISQAGFPADTRIHLGTYGVNGEASDLIHTLEGGRYAPMFKSTRTAAWEGRNLSPGGRAAHRPEPAGAACLPSRDSSPSRPYSESGGGSRSGGATATRSATPVARASGSTCGSSTRLAASSRSRRAERELVRGMLQGITFGRRPLGDRETKGWIWCTREALRVASRPVDAELTALWRQFERAAFRIVGEEYPNFVGDPRRAARTWSDGQRALAAGGPSRRALAGRYVAGMSPGYRLGVGLGGNVAGLSRAEVNSWRSAYIAERARLGVAGFGEFALVAQNARPVVFQDVSRAVARGMALLG